MRKDNVEHTSLVGQQVVVMVPVLELTQEQSQMMLERLRGIPPNNKDYETTRRELWPTYRAEIVSVYTLDGAVWSAGCSSPSAKHRYGLHGGSRRCV